MNNIPEDIRAEILFEYLQEGSFEVLLRGLHKRNACKDLLKVESNNNSPLSIELARMSLYDSLPEYIFHSFDCFDQMHGREMKERFHEEVLRQEQEEEKALAFFKPVDIALLVFKKEIYECSIPYASENGVLLNMLCDSLTDVHRQNKFIKKTLNFLPYAKYIRGNRTLLTILLRKVFKDEDIVLKVDIGQQEMVDNNPKYNNTVDSPVGDVFVGDCFDYSVVCYRVYYWSDEECDEQFNQFIDEMEQFRLFISDWFISVEEKLYFIIEDSSSVIRLSDTLIYNYLNYNTNL
jgi:hypothetical protein